MVQATALDLQLNGALPKSVQAAYDAVPDGDTLSDALWGEMLSAGSEYLETLSEEERLAMAEQFTGLALVQFGLLGRVTAQMGLYDILWAFLAVSTAWGHDATGRGARDRHRVTAHSSNLAEFLFGRTVSDLTSMCYAGGRHDLVFEVERQLPVFYQLLEERLHVLREHLTRVHGDLGG